MPEEFIKLLLTTSTLELVKLHHDLLKDPKDSLFADAVSDEMKKRLRAGL